MRILFIAVLLLISSGAYAQTTVFKNDDNILVVKKDTVLIRLNNYDGFASYSLYYGVARGNRQRKEEALMKLGSNVINDYSMSITIKDDSHLGEVSICRYDTSPIEFATVVLKNKNNKVVFCDATDSNGSIFIDDSISANYTTITINSLEMEWQQSMTMDLSKHYVIICRIPYPFKIITNRKRIKIKIEGNHASIIYNNNKYCLEKDQTINTASILDGLLFSTVL